MGFKRLGLGSKLILLHPQFLYQLFSNHETPTEVQRVTTTQRSATVMAAGIKALLSATESNVHWPAS